jgi:hypothetical protein
LREGGDISAAVTHEGVVNRQTQAIYGFVLFVGKLHVPLKVTVIFITTCDIHCVKITFFLQCIKTFLKKVRKPSRRRKEMSV